MNFLARKLQSLKLRLFKKTVYRGFSENLSSSPVGTALLYYKTDSLYARTLAESYSHTNHWEILEICRILNSLGFVVDVVDRDVDPGRLKLRDRYDVFIGIGAGDSGKYFDRIAARFPEALRIFYAAGPEPTLSNRLILERYQEFAKRTGVTDMIVRRMIKHVDVDRSMANTDAIFYIGNEFSEKSYARFGKPMYRIYPSSSPALGLEPKELEARSAQEFVYFGGSGNIVKGLDLLLEAFAQLPNLKLHVCAPDEEDFTRHYGELLKRSPNIIWHGFVDVAGRLFNEITSRSAFVVLPSCSEGTATSVTTLMRRGLIPVVTYEAGIDLGSFGFLISDVTVPALRELLNSASRTSKDDLRRMQAGSYESSMNYTQAGFSKSFRSALVRARSDKGRRE